MKTVYLAGIRSLRRALALVGILQLLDAWAARSRTGLWVRSLLSIYDLEDLLVHDVPWWTFTASDHVAALLAARPQARIFEWGSGASTVWLSRRAAFVRSVEHDAAWAEIIRPVLPTSATVQVVEPRRATGRPGEQPSEKPGFRGLDFADYAAAVDETDGLFDVIVVDGRARGECFRRAISKLAPHGVLVFDNVDRRRYRDAIASSPVPVDVQWTRGLTPALPYPTRTALVTLRG